MSAFSVSEPFPTFHDRDGQPLDAGYLYFGAAGLPALSNQIPVFVDALLTIPVAQPVRTTNGFPQYQGAACRLFVDADDFSVAVHQSDNTLVLSSLNATVRIPLAVTTGSLTSDQVTYVEGGIGSTTRILTSKLQESVSVFDFMTVAQIADVEAGTLLLDVTAPINAAIAASDEVYFPEGAYRVSNDGTPTSGAIQIPNGLAAKTLRGAGRGNAIVHNYGQGPCITSIGNLIFYNVSLHICDLTIQGTVGSGDGIFCDFTSQSMFERLEFYQCGVSGIKIQRGAHNVLTDIWSRANTYDGAFIGQEAYFTVITGGVFESNFRHGLNVDANGGIPPGDVTITGASFRTNTTHNVNVLDGASRVRLFGCSFTTAPIFATARHLSVDGGGSVARACLASGCTFLGQNNSNSVVGIFGNACEDLSVESSSIDCTGSDAYAFTASALRPRVLDSAIILGATVSASTSTVVRNIVSSPSPGTAFLVGTSAGSVKIQVPNNVPLVRFENQRVWGDSNNVYTLDSTPLNVTDGWVVGPGCKTFTVATLPAGAPVGTRVRCTNCFENAWGAILTIAGPWDRFLIWNGANWTIFGVGS